MHADYRIPALQFMLIYMRDDPRAVEARNGARFQPPLVSGLVSSPSIYTRYTHVRAVCLFVCLFVCACLFFFRFLILTRYNRPLERYMISRVYELIGSPTKLTSGR